MIIRHQDVEEQPLGDKPVCLKPLLSRDLHTESLSVTWIRMAGRCCQRMTCDLSDRVYYLLGGEGEFQVGDDPSGTVHAGDLVLIPKGVSYSFSGHMEYLVINVPAFVPGSDVVVD